MPEREILFRGQRADDGAWVYGWYSKFAFNSWPPRDCIILKDAAENGYLHHAEVDPSTLGQYTGLTDKNGVRIFEGDILHFINTYRGMNKEWLCTVEFIAPDFVCRYIEKDGIGCYNHFDSWNYPVVNWDVIGNIHDTPNLLGGNDGI